jgi:acyl carrier protein
MPKPSAGHHRENFMTRDAVYEVLATYIAETLLSEGTEALEPNTPLLEWGILNSMNTAKLLTFIRESLGVGVPITHITGEHFRTLETITDLVYSLDPVLTAADSPAAARTAAPVSD